MHARQHSGACASGPAQQPRQSDEALGVQAEGFRVQGEVDSGDCARRQSANQLTMQGEQERMLQGAKALATRLPCLGMTSDLAGMPLVDVRGAYRFVRRAAGGN